MISISASVLIKVGIQEKRPKFSPGVSGGQSLQILKLAISHSPDMWTLTRVGAQKTAFILQGDPFQDLGTRVTARV